MNNKTSKRPNFVVIVADDMGFSDAGCYGGEAETPNLDHLAGNGIRFTHAYSAGRCWPSRSCILTGYYAQQIRMDPPKDRLPSWTRLLPHYLKPAGYRCYHSGKWHVHGAPRMIDDGGFDRSYHATDHDRYFHPKTHFEDDQPLPAVPPGTDYYNTADITDHALKYLQDHESDNPDDPFLLYLAYLAPHFPLHAPQDVIKKYKAHYMRGWDVLREERWKRQRESGIVDCDLAPREPDVIPDWNLPADKLHEGIGEQEVDQAVAWDSLTDEQKEFQATKMAIHAAMIDCMDAGIGRVLEQLRKMDAYDNTVIMFVSDNGASAEQIIRGEGHDKNAPPGSAASYLCLGPGGSTLSNSPFRLHKSWVHEGGVSSPLIVHWPDGIKARGELRNDPVHIIDLPPTLMELAGVERDPEWKGKPTPPLSGRSFVSAFEKDGCLSREFIYFHHLDNKAIRCGEWKLVARNGMPWELYNMTEDRGEQNDLVRANPEKAEELWNAWEKWENEFRRMADTDPWPG